MGKQPGFSYLTHLTKTTMQFLALQVNSASGGMHDPLKFPAPHSLIIPPDIPVRSCFFHCYTETLITESGLLLKACNLPFSNLWVKACINAISVTVFLLTFVILAVSDHLMSNMTPTHATPGQPSLYISISKYTSASGYTAIKDASFTEFQI